MRGALPTLVDQTSPITMDYYFMTRLSNNRITKDYLLD